MILPYFPVSPNPLKESFATAQARYTEYLKRNKMFLTKERMALLEFIFAQKGHFSADELLFEMQRTGLKASRATLYRTLSQLVEASVLSESDFGHGHTHYEIELGTRPHVHLVSLESDDVKEVTTTKLEAAFNEILRKEGFSVKRYNIQIFGTFNGKTGKSKATKASKS
jgi:Fur family ferric uptake transcriptional regulator